MKHAIFACLLLSGCSGMMSDRAAAPGAPTQGAFAQNWACFTKTAGEAVHGDVHDIALPDFVPGNHLRAGQVSSCMVRG
jgi:hypothetical protein